MHVDWSLVLCISIPLAVGGLAGFATRDEAKGGWYASLTKPAWTPPGYVFGPVWTILYVLMGVASWRVWRAGGRAVPLALYAVQLALNLAWSLMFFKAHDLRWAMLDILALLGVLVATTSAFYRVDRTAGNMLVPYVAWVGFATALTGSLYLANPPPPKKQVL